MTQRALMPDSLRLIALFGIVVVNVKYIAFSTMGDLGLIATISRAPGPMMSRALAAGGSSLTIYLGQSILLTTIFSGYGLGLWNEVSQLSAILIAIAVTTALIIAVSLWRMRFKLGPFEWLRRRITYAGVATR